MAPSFGTSGLRGLVIDLTEEVVADYVHAFLTTVPECDTLFIGQDLRPSSPDIAQMIARTALEAGVDVVDCGAIGTPALALASMSAGAAAIMVTGSHIPADRNGLKFYVPQGEISKEDEQKITAAYAARARRTGPAGMQTPRPEAETVYVNRYIDAFGAAALSGLRIGVYRHSSVARDTMEVILTQLGATVVPLAHSDTFIPVDTEAVDDTTRANLITWSQEHGLDAVASTDGDADRPLLSDATGKVIPGDVLGVLTAQVLGAKTVITPVSSNDMVRRCPEFETVVLTRIGSPFVISEMEKAKAPADACVGFEANGGFLLGFDAYLSGPLAVLPTRDCMLPIIAPLFAAKQQNKTLTDLVAGLPQCFTAADRLQEIDRAKAGAFLTELIDDTEKREAFFAPYGAIASVDLTDGLRVDFESGDVVHLRPSGNAPEFRIYAQSSSEARAKDLTVQVRKGVAARLYS
ncbi:MULTISPECIES: phosphomannomutase [Pacificibacter]|uniref:phosphomannomutase n=1 Tax=Pacificibacter TaxID=1042323 RepID=UPI001C093B3F|nr:MULTISPECIES: phosphomannomutase [Pacificibacter]MBU2937409.1 phosphomannomutase [Pacificibacter marinus]MDO6617051.1 phosphomannomutase [Pacificibacter sp. 1_MG-2023]